MAATPAECGPPGSPSRSAAGSRPGEKSGAPGRACRYLTPPSRYPPSTCPSAPTGAASSPAGASSGSGGVTGGRWIPAGHSRSAGQWSENHWMARVARRVVMVWPRLRRGMVSPLPVASRETVETLRFRCFARAEASRVRVISVLSITQICREKHARARVFSTLGEVLSLSCYV